MDNQCVAGHTGPYCLVCAENYTKAIDKSCSLCEGDPGLSIAIQVSGVLAVLTVLSLVYLYYAQRGFKTKWTLVRLTGQWSTKIRIMTSLMQISGSFGSVFKVEYPDVFKSVLEKVSSFLTLDFTKMLPMDCIFPVDYVSSTVLRTSLITAMVGILYTLAWLLKYPPENLQSTSQNNSQRRATVFKRSQRATVFKRSQRDIPQNASQDDATFDSESTQSTSLASEISAICSTVAFYIVYLAYPGVMQMLFNFFLCDTWDQPGESGRSYLREDLSVECDSEYYQKWKIYAILMLVVYPFGVPLFYACIFFSQSSRA